MCDLLVRRVSLADVVTEGVPGWKGELRDTFLNRLYYSNKDASRCHSAGK